MKHKERPTDMLKRQLQANRNAAKFRNPETGERHFCHLPHFRGPFIKDMLEIRRELILRRAYMKGGQPCDM